jgi:hypothetical protein
MMTLTVSQSERRHRAIRNPVLLRLEEAQAAQAPTGAAYLETLALSCLIAAIAGVLPMVMYLRG